MSLLAQAGDPVRRGLSFITTVLSGIPDHPLSRTTATEFTSEAGVRFARRNMRVPPASPIRHGRMLKRPYPPRRQHATFKFNQNLQPAGIRTKCTASRASRPARRRSRRCDIKNHAADAGRDDRRRADLVVHASAGAAGAGDDVRRRHFHRPDDGVALHGRHRLLAARHGAAVRQVRPPAGAARGPRSDGGGEHRLLAGADAAATDRRPVPAGARRRHRHGGEPRHHPRPLQPRPHQYHDQPRHRRDDDGTDAERAGRRPAGDRVRLARDFLFHYRSLDQRRGPDRLLRCPRRAASAR